MLVKFQSRAAPDVVMLRDEAEYLLGLIGRRLDARGVIPHAELPAAIQRLKDAVSVAEQTERAYESLEHSEERMPANEPSQRAWPFLQMMIEADRLQADIIWGL